MWVCRSLVWECIENQLCVIRTSVCMCKCVLLRLCWCTCVCSLICVFSITLFLVSRQWVAMWQVFVGEGPLIEQVLTNLLEVLNLSLPYQEKIKGSKTLRVETAIPKAVSELYLSVVVCVCIFVYSCVHSTGRLLSVFVFICTFVYTVPVCCCLCSYHMYSCLHCRLSLIPHAYK